LDILARDILPVMPSSMRGLIERGAQAAGEDLEEIRLREGRPLSLVTSRGDVFLTPEGRTTADHRIAYRLGRDEMSRTFQLLSAGSVYALEEELKNGFLTLRGGHRVGLTGRAVIESGKIRTIKHIAGLNLRLAREIRGAADGIIPFLVHSGGIHHTLILSPPQAGKTTLLRDLIRQLSEGNPRLGLTGLKVGLVDERSEVAACYEGVPQKDVGPRTDVLDACPKAEGMMLLIRSISPQVIAADELGRQEDADAIMEAIHSGVTVLTTAHGASVEEVWRRPAFAKLAEFGVFQRAAVLSRSSGPGTIEKVLDLRTGQVLREETCCRGGVDANADRKGLGSGNGAGSGMADRASGGV
jgi:stage III sporulation protein AA